VAIFSSGFYSFLTDFLLFMIVWIAPWVAIFLTDWLMRRGRYDSRSLLTGRAGIYWRTDGVHVPGVVAQVVGMLAAASWLDTTVWQGPLSKATHLADFSVFMGAIFGAGVYYLLARRSVPREAVEAVETAEGVEGTVPA
jgi:purine-cytosine permease-like protein